MRTGRFILIAVAVVVVLLIGGVGAESIIYSEDNQEIENVTVTVNSTNNTTNETVNITVHKEPKGIIHSFIRRFHDPFDDAPVDDVGVKTYRGGLWTKNPDGKWTEVAKINKKGEITEVIIDDPNILDKIHKHHKDSPDVIYPHHHVIYPLFDGNGTLNGTNITFNDTSNTNDTSDNVTTSDVDDSNTNNDYESDINYEDESTDYQTTSEDSGSSSDENDY